MKPLFKSNIYKTLLTILILLLAVKIIWLIVTLTWLPSSGIEHQDKVGGKSLYYRVKLTPNEAAVPKKEVVKTVIAGSITDIELQAVYHAADTTVVTVLYKRKTKILGRGDAVNGFVLEGGGSNYATFAKNGKTYRIELVKNKRSNSGSGGISTSKSSQPVQRATSKKEAPKKVEGEVTDAGDHKIVDRSLLSHYANNMDDIYKNIGITEVKKDGAIKGFKITFVRRGSPFAKLGLKRGDMIKSINGQEIDSYNAAFETYKNIGNVENLTLVIQRGKEEMELEYEIN